MLLNFIPLAIINEKTLEQVSEWVIDHAPVAVLAIVTLIVGLWVVGMVSRMLGKVLEKRKVDPSVAGFFNSLVSVGLKVLLLISVASMIGIETTSFVAIFGAATLAVGMALQGSLGNFAGGVMILLFKPYKVGDLIKTQGHTGHVKEIRIFNTVLVTPDSKRVIIPNGPISNSDITNFTAEGHLRVDLEIGISYDADIRQARDVIMQAMKDNPKVLKDPAPSVNVLALGDNSVNLAVRPHTTVDDYWAVYFSVQEDAKYALDQAGIGIPYPQRDVHLYQHTAN